MDERKADCPCPAVSCPRHGICQECQAHHHASQRKPLTHCERLRAEAAGKTAPEAETK